MQLDSWTAIELEIDRIIDGNGDGAPFDKDTVDSVRDFVAFAREKCPVPEVGRGYRSAIRFSWSTRPPIEVEVYGDRFDLYRFHDGRTEIKEVRHTPGTAFPQALVSDLPSRD
jgi:hypothetical protein